MDSHCRKNSPADHNPKLTDLLRYVCAAIANFLFMNPAIFSLDRERGKERKREKKKERRGESEVWRVLEAETDGIGVIAISRLIDCVR
jgi:hypothetical protein